MGRDVQAERAATGDRTRWHCHSPPPYWRPGGLHAHLFVPVPVVQRTATQLVRKTTDTPRIPAGNPSNAVPAGKVISTPHTSSLKPFGWCTRTAASGHLSIASDFADSASHSVAMALLHMRRTPHTESDCCPHTPTYDIATPKSRSFAMASPKGWSLASLVTDQAE